MSVNDAYQFGIFFGAIAAGIITGTIPAVFGAIKGKVGLAIGGFLPA